MKCVVLAAGYATRLYPLTLDTPKPLLDVAGRSILDRILDKVERIREIDEVILVSNHKFFRDFSAWASGRSFPWKLTVIDDGSTGNENRLGAVADLDFAVRESNIRDDALVLAADNLFDFELNDFALFFYEKKADCITTHSLSDPEKLRRTGVIEIDKNWKVLTFEEKPRNPKSEFAVPPFYLYRGDTLPLVRRFLEEGGNPDAPGNFVPWLIGRRDVYAFYFEGRRYDIGSPETYRTAVIDISGKIG